METANAPGVHPTSDALQSGLTFLMQVAEAAPSFEKLESLAGSVASDMQLVLVNDNDNTATAASAAGLSQLATAYLRAAARHLPVAASLQRQTSTWSDKDVRAAAFLGDVLQVVSDCVRKVHPRTAIADTGILSVLHGLCGGDQDDCLVPAHCEFLQACIFAQEYQLAESQMLHVWPRPKRKSSQPIDVEIVLRYYYLRGVVHLNCGPSSYPLAMRSFWTCLTVPTTADTNVVSAIAVSAWKKLILVQSLQYCEGMSDATVLVSASENDSGPTTNRNGSFHPLSMPKEMSAGLSKFLSLAKAPPPASSNQKMNHSTSASPITSPMAPRVADPADGGGPEVMHVVEVDGAAVKDNLDDHDAAATRRPTNSNHNHRAEDYPSLGVYVYKELIKAFIAIDRTSFHKLVVEHGGLLGSDGNMGLVRRVGAALLHRHVYELSHVYAAVSLSQLSTELELPIPEVQSILAHLRTDKGWAVDVRSDDNVVVFPPAPPSPSLVSMDTMSKSVMTELSHLSHTIRMINGGLRKPAGSRNSTKDLFQADLGPRGVEDI